ncbi:MAG: PAS domain-containing protein, partial [Thiovulaceae bacterium]|nr:PAS domain-containing protein [Sulfurimonadaceae bacterium]
GYEKDEIMGQFHNIIRHQDMPRVVFKIFWDYLKAGKPVVAYVKNKTKEGAYYWVFAIVFPLGDEYISIRIKPNTVIFTAVKEIYFKLRSAESELNMAQSEELILKLLNEHGFSSYDHFMNEVLLAELLERKKLLALQKKENDIQEINSPFAQKIKPLYKASKILLDEYAKWFEKIDSFSKVKSAFEEKGLVLRILARDIVFLSLNASVASYKLDINGETFGVLASDVRTNAKENDSLIGKIHETSQYLSESLNEIIFLVSYISLQMEMVTYFIHEILYDTNEEINPSVDTLFELVSLYNEKLMLLPHLFDKAIQKNITYLEELDQQVMYLGYVQIYGIIESARCNDDGLGFSEIFSQLKNLIAKTSDEILLMKSMAEGFYSDNHVLMKESKGIELMLFRLKSEISNIKSLEK